MIFEGYYPEIGEVVLVKKGPRTGKRGKVTKIEPLHEDYQGEFTTYTVQFDGDQEHSEDFSYWELEPVS